MDALACGIAKDLTVGSSADVPTRVNGLRALTAFYVAMHRIDPPPQKEGAAFLDYAAQIADPERSPGRRGGDGSAVSSYPAEDPVGDLDGLVIDFSGRR